LGLLLYLVEHSADRAGARAHPDGHRGESSLAGAILVQPRAVAIPWATGELDASADVRLDAAQDALPELQHYLDGDAGKSADPVPDVPEPGAQLPPPERLAQRAQVAPCTPDEVQCGERSCAATARADALAQLAPLVLLPTEPVAVAARVAGASQKLEPQLVPREASQPSNGRAAQPLASLGG